MKEVWKIILTLPFFLMDEVEKKWYYTHNRLYETINSLLFMFGIWLYYAFIVTVMLFVFTGNNYLVETLSIVWSIFMLIIIIGFCWGAENIL